jgi:transposase
MEDKSEQGQKRPRRRFTEEFKAGAVRLVLMEGRSINGASTDLGVHAASLSRWVEQSRADHGKSKRGTLTTEEKEELTRLRKENRELRLEREILKKAAAFFAKENA